VRRSPSSHKKNDIPDKLDSKKRKKVELKLEKLEKKRHRKMDKIEKKIKKFQNKIANLQYV